MNKRDYDYYITFLSRSILVTLIVYMDILLILIK